MISKEIIVKRVKTYYRRLNLFRLAVSLIAIAFYIIAFFNIESLLIKNDKVTILLALISTGIFVLTFFVDHDKQINYYVTKIRK